MPRYKTGKQYELLSVGDDQEQRKGLSFVEGRCPGTMLQGNLQHRFSVDSNFTLRNFVDISRWCGFFGKSSAKWEPTYGTRPVVRRSGNGMWKDHRLYLSQRTSKQSSSRMHGNIKML